MISPLNLIHRTIVAGCIGFGLYGTVVIGQNFMVKRRLIAEERAQKAAAAAALEQPPQLPQSQ